jgi:uncharacterized protein
MQLHLDDQHDINMVNSYDALSVSVNDKQHFNSLIVSPDKFTENWSITSIDELSESHCELIGTHQTGIVLLGTGNTFQPVDPRFMVWFATRGMGLEVMDSGAACRTYNILASEGREVAAALIIEA